VTADVREVAVKREHLSVAPAGAVAVVTLEPDAREAVTALRERRPPVYRDDVPAVNDPDNAASDTKAPS
jgi:hypothetical protein